MSPTKQEDQQKQQQQQPQNRVHQLLQQKPGQQVIPPRWIQAAWWRKRRRRTVVIIGNRHCYIPYVLAVAAFCCCCCLYFWLFGYTTTTATDIVHGGTTSKTGKVVVGNNKNGTGLTTSSTATDHAVSTDEVRLEDGSRATSKSISKETKSTFLLLNNTTIAAFGKPDDEVNINRDSDGDDIVVSTNNNNSRLDYDEATTHPRRRRSYRGRLYYCGWTSGVQARWMFPDYRYVGKWQPPVQTMPFQRPSSFLSSSSAQGKTQTQAQHQQQQQQQHEMSMVERVIQSQPYTEQDLLVFGMHGPCAGESSYSVAKLMHYFPGKILFINGENFGNVVDHRQYHHHHQQQQQSSGSLSSSSSPPPPLSSSSSSTSMPSRSKQKYDPYARVFQIGPYPPRLQLRNTLQVYTGIYWSTKFFMSWKQNEEKKKGRTQQPKEEHVSKTTATTSSTSASSLTSSSSSPSSYPWLWLVDPAQRRKNTGRMGNAVVYLTTNCVPFRQYAARRIYDVVGLPIHTGPKCQLLLPKSNDNVSSSSSSSSIMTIPDDLLSDRKSYHTNYEHLFYHYKYCLVMENDAIDGYITEKIIMGFLGGCLPIYYGTDEIFDIFNRESFVFYNVSSFHHRRQRQHQPRGLNQTEHQPVTTDEDALKLLQQLESNVTLYNQMLSEPILRNGQGTINEYFSILPDLGDGSLNAKIRSLLMIGEGGRGPGRLKL